ncbi:MAG: C_GCAxxG_C_C family protein [Eggerthellaceae bacterium]|nr:C_GCAxxG_C_C family protein [Eggerthellaceae bacterium]
MNQQEIDERIARALEMHSRGFNCAQCVTCACADLVDADEATAFKMVEGLGGGMGGFTETCGAIAGGATVLGFATSDGPHNPRTKGATHKKTKQLVARFSEKNGSTLCKELKGLTGGPVLRSCDGCIEDALRLTLDLL